MSLLFPITALLVLCFAAQQTPATPPVAEGNPATLIESAFATKDWEPSADQQAPEWASISGVQASRDFFGEPVKLGPTEIRSRWTRKHLYLFFICPYTELHVKPDPVTDKETDKLWNWDVAEAFIGADYLKPARYKEFQVSPQGEYVDLDVDRDHPKEQKGTEWDSGMTVKGRVDSTKKIWYGEMRIPFADLDVKRPKIGDELRIGLFRIAGVEPKRTHISWRTTGAMTFHVPEAFGSMVLTKEPEKELEKDKEKEPKDVVRTSPRLRPSGE